MAEVAMISHDSFELIQQQKLTLLKIDQLKEGASQALMIRYGGAVEWPSWFVLFMFMVMVTSGMRMNMSVPVRPIARW